MNEQFSQFKRRKEGDFFLKKEIFEYNNLSLPYEIW